MSKHTTLAKQLDGIASRSKYLTRQEVLDAHAQFGRLDREAVKEAMGPNWPKEWDAAEMFR